MLYNIMKSRQEIIDDILSLLPQNTIGEIAIYQSAFRLLSTIPTKQLDLYSRASKVIIASDVVKFPGFGKETHRSFAIIRGYIRYHEHDVYSEILN
jgi:precorrin-2 methylase